MSSNCELAFNCRQLNLVTSRSEFGGGAGGGGRQADRGHRSDTKLNAKMK